MTGRLLLRWELRDALRSHWFLANGAAFLAGGVFLLLFGGADAAIFGYRGFARALAALVQLAVVLVPLMALFPATASVAGERELGTLDYLLAQPVTRGEVFSGKWAGVAAAVLLSLALAFSAIGLLATGRGVPAGLVGGLLGLTLLLGAAFVSLGLWISAGSSSRSRAAAAGLAVWLVLVALGSLGVMGAFVRWGLPPWLLKAWVLANPVEAYRVVAISLLEPDADLLGPAGAALLASLGRTGLVAAAAGSLLGWTTLAFWAGRRAFSRA